MGIHLPLSLIVFFIWSIFGFSLSARAVQAGAPGNDTISLITEGPASEVYTTWGHVSLRIHKDAIADLVYGFGTFDFNTPWFYLKFIQGSLNYTGSILPYSVFLQEEAEEPHYIVEQVLNLTSQEKQAVYRELDRLNLPDNRLYKYDLLYKNCSTKIRDVLLAATGSKYKFSRIVSPSSNTFRQELRPYAFGMPWLDFGTNLVFGLPTDKRISPYESAFLPANLKALCQDAVAANGTRLVSREVIINKAPTKRFLNSGLSPELVFWVLLICCILLSVIRGTGKLVDTIVFTSTGLLGIVLFYLCFIAEHAATRQNLNLVWALPINVLYPFLKAYTKRLYAGVHIFVCAFFLAFLPLISQSVEEAIIPLILLLFFRYLLLLAKPLIPSTIALN